MSLVVLGLIFLVLLWSHWRFGINFNPFKESEGATRINGLSTEVRECFQDKVSRSHFDDLLSGVFGLSITDENEILACEEKVNGSTSGLNCRQHDFLDCPSACKRVCTPSSCTDGAVCTADCKGPGSCIEQEISGFDSCATKYPVMKSNPAQCQIPGGEKYYDIKTFDECTMFFPTLETDPETCKTNDGQTHTKGQN